ncbi:PREDICTED: uncharacterized protein LOC104820797 isoform X1 [Tarenaya hassleriana]|uniref:uncharacterized protein LOC104820797 isoform X1 n=2 Tax=Tarenaya hassleriana TaxID=28532 RepID=UPI0008FCE4B7|nr:PREDICTED: uncharacterized protein LOC104820797 isoform X1 [Tarenaya hassleriana]
MVLAPPHFTLICSTSPCISIISHVSASHPMILSPRYQLFPVFVLQEQEATRNPSTQPSATSRFSRKLFKGMFFSQLTLVSVLVIVLTIRGLISADSHHFHPKKWYPPLLTSVAVSGTLSLAWQCIFLWKASATLKAAFYISPIFTCSVGIMLVLTNSTPVAAIGALFVFFSIVQSLYACWITERLEYATKILSSATLIPPAKTNAIVSLSVIVGVLYSGFLVTGIGGATSTRTNLDILFISLIVISLAWTMQVLKNIQEVTISRARYINFTCGEDMDTCNAFRVTVKTLLGSVCIGSTIVPLIVFARGMARSLKLLTTGGENFMCFYADCCLNVANTLITFGNRWGFVHVGIYDKGFVDASTDIWHMFRRIEGFEQLIDSDLTGSFCFLSGVIVGAISALTGGIWVLLIHKDYTLEVTLYAFIIGYFVFRVASAWLQACVLAYYVAYVEDPHNARFDATIPRRIQRLQMYNARDNDRDRARDSDGEMSEI